MAITTWALDSNHSEIIFKVRHLMITSVTGSFDKFNLIVETEGEEFLNFKKIEFMAKTASVQTKNEQRDHHLRSVDFFDVEAHPTILFVGKQFEGAVKNRFLVGALTIKGITKTVRIAVEFGGIVADSYGHRKAGFSFHGVISRKAFGLLWNDITESGNVVVGDEVKFHGEIQLIKRPS